MLHRVETTGRVLDWRGSEVTVRYEIAGGDSLTQSYTFVMTADQRAVKAEAYPEMFYHSKRPHIFDFKRARQYDYPLPQFIVFCISGYVVFLAFRHTFGKE